MRRLLVAGLILLFAGAARARAQIIDSRTVSNDPVAWTTLSAGWMRVGYLCDPDSNSCWDFGGAPQFRASLGVPLGRGAAFGVAASTSRVPLQYTAGLACAGGCDADANVSQIFANFLIAGGSGLHQVIDLNAGATLFSNFRSTDGTKLEPAKMTSAMTFGLGYGFGYTLSPRLSVMVVQDYAIVIHKRISGQSENTAQQTSLRFGARYGLGSRRRGF